MRDPLQPDKRVVSKGRYAALITRKIAVGTGSVGLAILTAALFVMGIGGLFGGFVGLINGPFWLALLWFAGCAVSFWLAWISITAAEMAMAQARKNENVVPLTRATAAQLPAKESLVRAADRPAEAQEGILLRPAAASQDASVEELVIPIQGEKTHRKPVPSPPGSG